MTVEDEDENASPVIQVAGREVTNPASAVLRYMAEHGGTVAHHDLAAGSFTMINLDLIRATRNPWMYSRISNSEAAWFIQRGREAPWHLVATDADLADADPAEVGGLYDRAEQLYEHVHSSAPSGISVAKVSKVLHLMRPLFYPILDDHLMRFYKDAAATAAKTYADRRPELARFTRLHWAAIRDEHPPEPSRPGCSPTNGR